MAPTMPQDRIYRDRHGHMLEPGSRVRVQYCCGRYGATRQLCGVLLSIDRYDGMLLTLDAATPPFGEPGRDRVVYYKGGDSFYVASVFTRTGNGEYRGQTRFDDFEHGHEQWVELS